MPSHAFLVLETITQSSGSTLGKSGFAPKNTTQPTLVFLLFCPLVIPECTREHQASICDHSDASEGVGDPVHARVPPH